MKEIFKKRVVTSIFSIALLVFAMYVSMPLNAKAQGGLLPFGGFVTYEIPCTCSGNFWLLMAPFFAPTQSVGALVYAPGSTIVYAYHMIPVIGVWLLGDYMPGVQACYITIPYGCLVIPSYGVMHQTGTGQ